MEKIKVKNKNDEEIDIPVYSIEDFPMERINPITLSSRHGGREKIGYMLEFGTFDIETSTLKGIRDDHGQYKIPPSAFMYHWQACLGGICVFGRRWEEFFTLVAALSMHFNLKKNKKHFVIYVHNLGFELSFMYPFFEHYFGGYSLFAVDSHKPIKVTCENGIEFRCSYKLSNMSLYMFTKSELYCPYIKSYRDLDYSKIRTANTKMSSTEKIYCLIDVLGLYHAIRSLMLSEKDNITSIPLTSTGYVRRTVRRACRNTPGYRDNIFKKLTLSYPIYVLLKEESRGGNTHASRFLSGRILEDLESYDYVSSYIAWLCLMDFPMSKFEPYGAVDSLSELDDLCRDKAVIFRVTFEYLRVKDDVAMPYLPISKARYTGSNKGMIVDNGRILSIPKGSIVSYTLNEIDWAIVKDQYLWDSIAVYDLHIAKKAPLPAPIVNTVLEIFKKKCDLKNQINLVKNRLEREKDNIELLDQMNDLKYLYGKIKNKLNSVFGMMFQDPVQRETTMTADGIWSTDLPEGKTVEFVLDAYYKSRNSFLNYSWGCWITAYARLALHKLQSCCAQEGLVYSDTDSVKGFLFDRNAIDRLNQTVIERSDARGIFYECNGHREYMGVAELDSLASRFITLGAKKYCYESADDGLLHLVISGVSATIPPGEEIGEGAAELQKIENFKDGFVFRKAGGIELFYAHKDPYYISINGCRMLTASYAAAIDSTYTLSITDDYRDLIGYI